MLEYLRHNPDTQLDADGKVHRVWLFEFRIHDEEPFVPLAADAAISERTLATSKDRTTDDSDDDVIVQESDEQADAVQIEQTRRRLLALDSRQFELFIKDLLVNCGFADVCVTRLSADGGVDVNARAGARMWALERHIGSGAGETLAALGRTPGGC